MQTLAEKIEAILRQTEQSGVAAQARAVAEFFQKQQLPPRHAVGGIITPQ